MGDEVSQLSAQQRRAKCGRKSTLAAFLRWLHSAPYGSRAIYHEGLLSADKAHDSIARELARAASEAEAEGRVLLVQRRLGHGRYEYIAIKRRRRSI